MNIGLRVFGPPLPEYPALAVAAEQAGFSSIWVPDHVLSVPPRPDVQYPYRTSGRPSFDGHTPFGDPLILLAAVATQTTTIELGVGIYVLPLRHPVHAARQVLTLQELAAGRLTLGVGVGWSATEFEAVGAEFRDRGSRTEEMLGVMRQLWTGQLVSHDGTYYSHPAAQMAPPAAFPTTILWGGATPRAIARGVRLASGAYAPPGDLSETLEFRDRVHKELAAHGRTAADFRIVVRCPDPPTAQQIAVLSRHGLTDIVVNLPRQLTTPESRISWIATASESFGLIASQGHAHAPGTP